MMIDFAFMEKVKQKVFTSILSEMNTKDKQKSLSKHIMWSEPKTTVFSLLLNKIKQLEPKLLDILQRPTDLNSEIAGPRSDPLRNAYLNEINHIVNKYFLAFPDPLTTLVGINLFFPTKNPEYNNPSGGVWESQGISQVGEISKQNVKKVAQNYLS